MKPQLKGRKTVSPSPTQPLHIRLRPSSLDEVVGQDAIANSLRKLLANSDTPHAFLFTGPSGCGKTTLARIVGRMLGCTGGSNVIEIDAATHSGIESMRAVLEGTRYAAMAESPRKFYIVDEAHALSKATWQSLLKAIEEPPEHVYWALCTTEADKVPTTIRTRCHAYEVKSVPKSVLSGYLEIVAEQEGIELHDESVLDLAAGYADGSVRQALVNLSRVSGCDREEALALLRQAEEGGQAIDLVRMIATGKGFTWDAAMRELSKLADENPESIRIIVVNYVGKMLQGARKEQEVVRLLKTLAAFSEPYRSAEKNAPLLLSIGSTLFEG